MANCQPVQETCKAEVFETKACGKRQVGMGVRSRVFYVSIIYCIIVVGKYPFLSLHYN